MSDNRLIWLDDAMDIFNRIFDPVRDSRTPYFCKLKEEMRTLPPVQPMRAVEYEKVLDRMISNDHIARAKWADARFDGKYEEAVAIVEKWAKEHPEESRE